MAGGLPTLDARNRFRHTPLHVAASARRVRATRLLLEFGANPTLRFDGVRPPNSQ